MLDYWLDAILAVPLVWMAYKGFSRGFIMEVSRLIALITGIYLAARFSSLLAEHLYRSTEISNEFLPVIAFALILVAVFILVYLFGKMLAGMVKMVALGWADKLAGVLLGLVRGALIISLMIMLLDRFMLLDEFKKGETAKASHLFDPLQSFAPFILPVLEEVDKDSVMDKVRRKADRAEERLRELIP